MSQKIQWYYKKKKERLTSVSLKIVTGASTLFFLAASLTMASASSIRPWVINHRGDSGMNLHNQLRFRTKVNKTGCLFSYLLKHGWWLWEHYIHPVTIMGYIPPQWDVDHSSCGQNSEKSPPFSDAICNPGKCHVPNAIEKKSPEGCEDHSHSFT